MKREVHIINAKGKVLGRLAVEIAILLRGKYKSDFVPNKDMGDFVTIEDFEKIYFSGKKFENKKYFHHSGYLGGLKETKLKELFQKNPGEVLRKAVFGMLPGNKLRPNQIKRLKIQEKEKDIR